MRIAFIGTGGISQRHAEGLAKRDDVAFVGAFDIVAERGQSFVAKFGGMAYSGGVAEMLDGAKPDAVWVCLPPFAHGQAEMALLERRIPFLVEKPISNSMATDRDILKEVERSGTLAVAGYMNRYRRGVSRVRELLADDPAVLVHGGWIGGMPRVPWWLVKAQSGGQIVEQTTHTIDLVRYIVGEPKLVYAQGAKGFVSDVPNYDVEDASTIAVQFASGAVGNLMSSCAGRTGGGGVHLTLVAVHHHVAFTGWEHSVVIRKSRLEEERVAGEPDIFEIEDAAFVEAVQTGDASGIRSTYADALKTLAFCLAANQSLETGLPVEVASI